MVMRKCGMKYEGRLRSSDRNNQGICDADWYALLRDEREGISSENFDMKDNDYIEYKLQFSR